MWLNYLQFYSTASVFFLLQNRSIPLRSHLWLRWKTPKPTSQRISRKTQRHPQWWSTEKTRGTKWKTSERWPSHLPLLVAKMAVQWSTELVLGYKCVSSIREIKGSNCQLENIFILTYFLCKLKHFCFVSLLWINHYFSLI